jgi:peptidoglycan hydrolase-like protein with peptidoglycan-binding domain
VRRSLVAVFALTAIGAVLAAPLSSSAAPPSPAAGFACTADAIAADTGMTLLPEVVCSAGFAMALVEPVPSATSTPAPSSGSSTSAPPVPCQQVSGCSEADIFHVTLSGWVYDGRHGTMCAENLGVAFMSPQTAATFAFVCDEGGWPEPPTVNPGDEGLAVVYVQIALVALGVDVAVDGTYDFTTEHAIRQLQSAYGLDPTGIVGPETHALLGTGPIVPGAPSPTTTSTTTSTTTTSTTTTSTSTTTTSSTSTTVPPSSGMAPGTPRPCTDAAVSADVGLVVAGISACHGGWALGMLSTTCPPTPADPDAECETADVFHVTSNGWVHVGSFYPYCADYLAFESGMSIHTALQWSPICGDTPVPERTNIEPGSRGAAVQQVQIALVALGYPIEVDGEYGPRTEAAVSDFQQRNGLDVDGIAGPDTQVALGV